jgi:hypothetical protein
MKGLRRYDPRSPIFPGGGKKQPSIVFVIPLPILFPHVEYLQGHHVRRNYIVCDISRKESFCFAILPPVFLRLSSHDVDDTVMAREVMWARTQNVRAPETQKLVS